MTSCQATCTRDANPSVQKTCGEVYLFLLEFYICQIKSARLAKLNQMFCMPTTVDFRFLDFKKDDKLQVTPVDPMFEPQSGIADDVEPFYAGKSVLFALDQNILTDMYREFKIKLIVSKKMPMEMKPDVIAGKAEIDMTLHFAALRKEIIDSARYVDSVTPNPSKTFDDEIPLIYETNAAGSMSVFARISAYGQTIVTEFESPPIDTSATSFLFKSDDRNCDDQILKYKCRVLDPMSCNLSDILSEKGSKECNVCKPRKMPCTPCRVQSGSKICEPKKVKKCDEKSAEHPICVKDGCRPIQTSRGPKEPCGKAVVLKVSGLIDPCAKGDQEARVTVAPECEATNPNDLDDPDHDIFILRIGKKGLVGVGEKSDIQLEMRTPKGPERRRPVRLETREMQTEEETGKKGKGKKKK